MPPVAQQERSSLCSASPPAFRRQRRRNPEPCRSRHAPYTRETLVLSPAHTPDPIIAKKGGHVTVRHHTFCPLAYRLPSYWRRADRALQLGLCQENRGQDAA